MSWVCLFLGGGVGTVLRAAVSAFVQVRTDGGFPWGILTVNLVGCALIGWLVTFDGMRDLLGENGRLFAVTGLLGGFTTFSAFGMDTFRLLAAGEVGFALINACVSVLAGVAAVALGVAAARLVG